jgi:putative PIN family toxin of toxin-antitoxin system
MTVINIVLDANIYASSLIKPDGTTGNLLKALFQDGRYNIIASNPILSELERVLWYPKIRDRISLSDQEIDAWFGSLSLVVEIVNSNYLELPVIVVDDPDDDKYIIAAMMSQSQYIITGDNHLLKLNPYQEITILKPRMFIELECL